MQTPRILCSRDVFPLTHLHADINRAPVQAGIRASHGDTIAEAFYLMQCMYQIPQNAETATLELASAGMRPSHSQIRQ